MFQPPPCRALIIAGLPCAGKEKLASEVLKRFYPNPFQRVWRHLRAARFHTEESNILLARGEILRRRGVWTDWLASLERNLRELSLSFCESAEAEPECRLFLIVTATLLTPTLRKRVIEMGKRAGSEKSAHSVIWLNVSEDVAKRRLQEEIDRGESSWPGVQILDKYFKICQPPEPLALKADTNAHLFKTAEENVFWLNANNDSVVRKADRVIGNFPDLRDYEVA